MKSQDGKSLPNTQSVSCFSGISPTLTRDLGQAPVRARTVTREFERDVSCFFFFRPSLFLEKNQILMLTQFLTFSRSVSFAVNDVSRWFVACSLCSPILELTVANFTSVPGCRYVFRPFTSL